MARFMVKASEFKNVCKAVNDRKLAELKKEIIEILKKQDEKDVKKAIDYFNSQEKHYTHLEKSLISGKWIQKAGYGVGTVRIWKGKKYKKIAPGKWARVFDKEGRGTNIAIGKLIARVQKIDNVEDLMAFVMQNKQRFVDENGIDLPVLDKLRAAVDAKNNGDMGSKTTSKPAESKKESKEDLEAALKEVEDAIDNAGDYDDIEELEKERKQLLKKLGKKPAENTGKKEEAEAEKTQNRSEAMKGNQNARKYGLTDEQIEYYDIQEVVEDVNGYGIVKNSEGKYSFIEDGRVKDRPDDFETDINKVKERINDATETKKNVEAAKNYDFANADFGPDVKYQKKNNGKHEYYKKDGSKAISVTIDVSDMREPLNMTYEVTDTKSGESWQYETAYGNKEGLEWAVERPDQMEKELKKFFKRDPNKEWEKQNTFEKETVIDRSISTNNPEKLKPIAKSESIGEGKVKMPYSKEVSDEIKHLTNTSKDAVTKGSRYDFLSKIYYDKGNLVSTDGNKLKIVKVGELDGIDNGTFVDIDNSKEGITITADKEFTKEHKFPQYERVIPDGNNEKIVLDNKALISKIKDLKKDGGITKKDSYVTMDIQGNNLMLDGVKVGDVSAANFEGENSDYINLDADILTSYLSGDKTDLYSSKDSSKAMYFGNGSAINIIMPQRKTESHIDANGKETIKQRRKDYNSMRKDKEVSDEIKTRSKALRKELNEGYVENIVNGYKRSVPANFEEKSIEKLKEWTTEQLQRMYKVANVDIDSLMEKKDFNSDSFSSFCYKNFDMSPHNLIGQNYAMKDHPAIVREIERLIKEKGGKIEKSLFDDFIVDVFAADDEIEDEEELKAGETEYNDYSAEQPELFNSTEMMVSEAFSRCDCL
jgi:acylphosphatase